MSSTDANKTISAAQPDTATATKPACKLGLTLLVALVVGSIIGSGIFGLPQNMAAGAGAGAILIGWTVTGIGMLLLVRVYQMLSMRKPELDNGVYAYARALSGEYVGFNSAWGYWVSARVGNVGYLVAAFGALGFFFPMFGSGNSPAAIAGASIVLWVIHLLVLRGIQGAAVLNAVVTLAKIVPLLLFTALAARQRSDTPVAALATLYCVWLLYAAAGFKYLLLSALLYVPGVLVYAWAKRQRQETAFTKWELLIFGRSYCAVRYSGGNALQRSAEPVMPVLDLFIPLCAKRKLTP